MLIIKASWKNKKNDKSVNYFYQRLWTLSHNIRNECRKKIYSNQTSPSKSHSAYAPCDKPENRIILSLGLPVNVFLSRLVKLFIRLRSTWQKKMPEFDIESRDEGFSEIIFKAAAVFSHMNQRMWGREWEKLSTIEIQHLKTSLHIIISKCNDHKTTITEIWFYVWIYWLCIYIHIYIFIYLKNTNTLLSHMSS